MNAKNLNQVNLMENENDGIFAKMEWIDASKNLQNWPQELN